MRFGISLCLSIAMTIAASAFADDGANHRTFQPRPIQLGTSGSNVKDHLCGFCCGGTLGSLVTDGIFQYILSNNHVLARINIASSGEAVSQPGNLDMSCSVPASNYVANFARFIRMKFASDSTNDMDCAIAKVIPGNVDPGGAILDIGQISGQFISAPAIGLSVKKSGRTTGLTTGTVTGLNANVKIEFTRCGSSKIGVANFVNQVMFSGMSLGGDSGSLIVENVATCPRPVALGFAGSHVGATMITTYGNPIGPVLSALGMGFVHGSCPSAAGPSAAIQPDFALNHAIDVQNRNSARLLQVPGVVGTAVGKDATGRYVVQILVVKDEPGVRAQLPSTLEGLESRVIETGVIKAY